LNYSFSICEVKKEGQIMPYQNHFLRLFLSTICVDKFFLFDCQKDMKKWEKMVEFGTL
jgi:hypothetical protein